MDYSNKKYDYQRRNYTRHLYSSAKYKAGIRNIKFNLTEDEIKQKFEDQEFKCYYTNIKFDFINNGDHYPSLDRIDSSKDYNFSNLVICIQKLNLMKNVLSIDEFVYLCKKVANNKKLKKKA